jgi:hypothetical protein
MNFLDLFYNSKNKGKEDYVPSKYKVEKKSFVR